MPGDGHGERDAAGPLDWMTEEDLAEYWAAQEEDGEPLAWRPVALGDLPEDLLLHVQAEAEALAAAGVAGLDAADLRVPAAATAESHARHLGVPVLGLQHFRAVATVRSHGLPALLVGEVEVDEAGGWGPLTLRLVAPAHHALAPHVAVGPDVGEPLAAP